MRKLYEFIIVNQAVTLSCIATFTIHKYLYLTNIDLSIENDSYSNRKSWDSIQLDAMMQYSGPCRLLYRDFGEKGHGWM